MQLAERGDKNQRMLAERPTRSACWAVIRPHTEPLVFPLQSVAPVDGFLQGSSIGCGQTRLIARISIDHRTIESDPIDSLVIPVKAFHVAQMQKAQPEAPVALVMGQADQPVRDLVILIRKLRQIPVAGLADTKDPAGQANTQPPHSGCLLGHLASSRWP